MIIFKFFVYLCGIIFCMKSGENITMNEFKENIFYKTYPRIDLHGMTSDIAEVFINDFISENLKLGNEYIIIIHGIGKGILSKKTEYILKQNKNVISYKKDYFNLGITLVKINVDKCHKL